MYVPSIFTAQSFISCKSWLCPENKSCTPVLVLWIWYRNFRRSRLWTRGCGNVCPQFSDMQLQVPGSKGLLILGFPGSDSALSRVL